MTSHVSTDAKTQELSHLPPVIVAGADADTAPSVGGPGAESVQRMYEVGLAKLATLHDGWAAAVAELGKGLTVPDAAAA